ncbi:MAG: glycosyltransferase [Thermoplasmata archaeon]
MTDDTKVTVYVTVLNERDNIALLLDSLLTQTRKPDEILVIDGGSTDGTTGVVRKYIWEGNPIRLIESPGSNVAVGRNIGIENASHDIVASTDAGCRVERDWLDNLLDKFSDDVDIVSGVYLPDARTTFEECVGELHFPDVDRLPDDWYFPSHRSVAFRKKVWETIGPIPERLYRSEDSWFDLEAKRRGFRFKIAKDARVYWRPRKNLKEVYRNFHLWTKSDIENGVRADRAKHIARVRLLRVLWRVLGLSALLFCGVYLSWFSAVILAPFIFKEMVQMYLKDRSLKKTVYKNLINLAECVGSIAGYLSASWELRKTGNESSDRNRIV